MGGELLEQGGVKLRGNLKKGETDVTVGPKVKEAVAMGTIISDNLSGVTSVAVGACLLVPACT